MNLELFKLTTLFLFKKKYLQLKFSINFNVVNYQNIFTKLENRFLYFFILKIKYLQLKININFNAVNHENIFTNLDN